MVVNNETFPISAIDTSACVLPCPTPTGEAYLASIGLDDGSILVTFIAMLSLYVAFKACQFPLFKFAGKRR